MKTIKQLSDELGVSKDKIKYQCKKLPSNYLVKKNGITYLKNEAIEALFDVFVGKKSGNYLGKLPTDYLLKELDIKNHQLDEKDKQITELQKLLDQQQKLSLITAQENETLRLELKEQEKPRCKKWFWSK